MSANMLDALNKLAAIKQLNKDTIQTIILEAVTSTLQKRLEPEAGLQVYIDELAGCVKVKFKSLVVEREEGLGQISLIDARNDYYHNVQLGEYIEKTMTLSEFEPKIVKTVQKIIQDKIRQLEEEKIQNDFNKQKHTIVTGKIKAIDDYGGYIIDTGHVDALLPVDEQIENEFYRVGDNIKAYVVNIRTQKDGVVIILSRTNPEFVKKLFEAEIPAIFSGEIKIRKIVREPGIRTKVELEAEDPKVDPIVACVGPKGTRIDSLRKELHGEQIDIVLHSDDPEKMIENALGVEGIKRVIIERNHSASVILDEADKLMAIGKQGKNVKLAAKLVGMKIDIYTMAEFEEKMAKERRTVSHITELDGVTPKIAETLKQAGYTSVQDIYTASLEELCNLEGMGQKTAERLKEAAKYF
ncbi:MAG: transcription termination factor NusA [Candidatus Cloacimonadota bacterium]|jgi:N utilization substance protein A|uniref:Transcription termination/antitermination protein NusA n=1 Tax=Cloacimonas acidaminovorans (strain Evry) TaxID=459349 RepID=B0VFB8_CLOAI|nr:transcription termination factor NusA [Candidatus Cloacimonas acidaminovorans]MBP8704441.1 transcription termination factor NusA [Candidatus Cloacimonas sp.]MDI9572524.1 transcription termination factor NusA [Candidatus Cloacimonadota bacterium]CAO80170.1 transcription elongation factor NusA [Candidatus Cloacimonas acidaminovorans str. Evry]HNV61598.1 transcription termination factor NusA [Candidatus Cloacimonas acidaminovorans]HNZ88485.1 transcription termination factor NusA [Candidatus Cl